MVVKPPSIIIVCPVIHLAFSLMRYSTIFAISLTRPIPRGIDIFNLSSFLDINSELMGVCVVPGAIAFTRTTGANSLASVVTKAFIAPFDAA